jgi:iron complex outermembrane receptor protein
MKHQDPKSRRSLLGGASLLLAALPAFAAAQSPPVAEPVGAPAVEEVVITAQKRTERLQDVPVAANVVGTAALTQSNAGFLSDLNKMVASVNMTGPINSKAAMGIRGVSSVSNQGAVGIISGVAVLVDGVPVPSDSFAASQLEDVQRVEVLKGPQATLGGRSAAQGVINIVTRAPSSLWTGSASYTRTDDQEQRINAFLSGPVLGDKLAFSLGAYDNSRDYPLTNAFYGTKTHEDTYGGRGKLLFKPVEDLDITLAASLSTAEVDGAVLAYSYITPGATLLGIPGFLGQAQLLPGITPSLGNQVYNSPVPNAGFWAHDGSVSLDVNYALGDYTLSSTTAYQEDSQKSVNDLFVVSQYFFNVLTRGAGRFDNTQTLWRRGTQLSQEVKLVSPAGRQLSYVVGAFYSDAPITGTVLRRFAGNPVDFSVKEKSSTYDLYGRATWRFSEADSLVTGLRYNYDRISYSLNQVQNGVQRAFYSRGRDTSSALVGDLSLQHRFASGPMVYATYARGYAPEAYNTTATLTSNTPLEPVDRETIDHFEIGSKGVYFDRRLVLNVAVFDTIYRDYQVQTYRTAPGSTVAALDLTSAGKAQTRGVEIDAVASPTRNLKLNLSAAYVHAVFDRFEGAPCYSYARTPPAGCVLVNGQSIQDVSGKPMPNAPKLKLALGAEQRIPLAAAPFDVVLGGTYAYQASAQMLYDQNPEAVLPAFGVLNLSVGLTEKSGRYSATFFVNNVFDHHYPVFVADFWNSVWANNAVVAQPARDSSRYAGVRLAAGF